MLQSGCIVSPSKTDIKPSSNQSPLRVPKNKSTTKNMPNTINASISIDADLNQNLRLSINNIGDSSRYFSLFSFNEGIEIRVTKPNGETVPLSDYGRQLADSNINNSPASRSELIKSGESESTSFPINKIFNPLAGVEYSIQIVWSIWIFDSSEQQAKWLYDDTAGAEFVLSSNVLSYTKL